MNAGLVGTLFAGIPSAVASAPGGGVGTAGDAEGFGALLSAATAQGESAPATRADGERAGADAPEDSQTTAGMAAAQMLPATGPAPAPASALVQPDEMSTDVDRTLAAPPEDGARWRQVVVAAQRSVRERADASASDVAQLAGSPDDSSSDAVAHAPGDAVTPQRAHADSAPVDPQDASAFAAAVAGLLRTEPAAVAASTALTEAAASASPLAPETLATSASPAVSTSSAPAAATTTDSETMRTAVPAVTEDASRHAAADHSPRHAAPLRGVTRDLDTLDPAFRQPLTRVMSRLRDEGYQVRVNETARSQQRQDMLFAQGRTAPGPVVTWTRRSHHREGRAADLVVEGPTGQAKGYERLRAIAADEGLRTLGRRDPGHVELSRAVAVASAPSRRAPADAAPADAAPAAPTTPTVPAAPATLLVPSVELAAAPPPHTEVDHRIAHIADVIASRTQATLSRVALEVEGDNGEVTRILVALRGTAVRTAIQTASSHRAAELSSTSGRLHEALASVGLHADEITVRQATVPAPTTAAPALDGDLATRGWLEGVSGTAAESRQPSGTTFARNIDTGARTDDERRSPRQPPSEGRSGFRSRRFWSQEFA